MPKRLFGKRDLARELQEEFEAHLALETRLLRERGIQAEEAEIMARRSFGNKSLISEQAREAWIFGWADRLMQDLRYAARTISRNATFSAAAPFSIALAIGAGTAVYSIADTVFLRPLPYAQPDRLMWVGADFPWMKMAFLGSPDYIGWRRDNRTFEDLAATQLMGGQIMLLNGPEAAEVHDVRVSANFLRTLGIRPAVGRDFQAAEELPNGPRAAILTHHLWQQRFHSDPGIAGRVIRLDGEPYTVAGVLPASFEFPVDEKLDILTTLPVAPTLSYQDRSVAIWAVYGRLKPRVSTAEARADLARLFARSKAAMPKMFRPGTQLVLEPLQQHRVGNAHLLLVILIGAVTCLLLIACTNVSNLLLARWPVRFGEFAVRAAIGASRGRLVRQLWTEACLLGALGCAGGMLLAFGILRGFVHYAGNELPRMAEITLDTRVFGIGFLVALATTLVFGGIPALQARRVDIRTALEGFARTGLAGGFGVTKRVLIAGEVALCLMLLSGGALLLETLWHLRNDRLGFEPEHVLSVTIPLKGTRLETGNRTPLIDELLNYIRRIPGTEAAAQSECTPLTAGWVSRPFSRLDRPLPEAFHAGDTIHVCGTGAEYAKAAGLRLLRGRFFSTEDFHHPDTVAVLNATAARLYLPGEDPIGKQILGSRYDNWKTVIGVVSDSKNLGLDAQPAPEAYLNGPVYSESTVLQLVIRHVGDAPELESAIASKLHSLDSGLTANFEPLNEVIAEMSGGARFNAILVGSFAAIAFLMAIIGVYGVLAFAVAQRTHEIGIRIAVGGEPNRIFRSVLQEGFGPVFAGIALGLLAAFGVTRYLKSLLYGVSAMDPVTLLGVASVLVIASGIAIAIPARRASGVDPMIALRHY